MPPPAHEGYPTRDDVLDYLARYEARYEFPIKRPVRVESIERAGDRLAVVTDKGRFAAQAVVRATGPWSHPSISEIEGRAPFQGGQVHSAHYIQQSVYKDTSMHLDGGGNSGAQIVD